MKTSEEQQVHDYFSTPTSAQSNASALTYTDTMTQPTSHVPSGPSGTASGEIPFPNYLAAKGLQPPRNRAISGGTSALTSRRNTSSSSKSQQYETNYKHVASTLPVWLIEDIGDQDPTPEQTPTNYNDRIVEIAEGDSDQAISELDNGEGVAPTLNWRRRLPTSSFNFASPQNTSLKPLQGVLVAPLKLHTHIFRHHRLKFVQGESKNRYVETNPHYQWGTFANKVIRRDILGKEEIVDVSELEGQYDFDTKYGGDDTGELGSTSWFLKRKLKGFVSLFRNIEDDEKYKHGADLNFREFVSEKSRQSWKPKFYVILLNDPYVPLTFRTIMFSLSCVALSLSASVFVHSKNNTPVSIPQQPSTIMALVVQSIALVYIVYITYDEYSGKPLGLRDAGSKIRLIMLDLLFIIFSSANTALAFNTMCDNRWVCRTDEDLSDPDPMPYNYAMCSRQKGLVAFLLMILFSWVSTFSISIFRLVERVAGDKHN
ncbi:Regulator of phospholipase D SRF1 [Yarrowia sp. C11]|nr:Regulator of phospholipase D SRF1 [Yarrowia sp. E02]KAG5369521.1 Regulator of phospholipase D SRF1 [Yarrowia sp. C11]